MNPAYDRLISICWDNCSSSNTLNVSAVRTFISEIENALNVSRLLEPQELALLQRLIAKNPLMQLHRDEAAGFLLRLAGVSSMDQLFSRFNISVSDVIRLVDAYPRNRAPYGNARRDKEYNDVFKNEYPYNNLSGFRRNDDFSVNAREAPLRDRRDPTVEGLDGKALVEDSTWYQRIKNSTISFLPTPFRSSQASVPDEHKPSHTFGVPYPYIKREEVVSNAHASASNAHTSASEMAGLREKIRLLEDKLMRYETDVRSSGWSSSSRRAEEMKRALAEHDAHIDRLEQTKYNRSQRSHKGLGGWSQSRLVLFVNALRSKRFSSLWYSNPIMNLVALFLLTIVILNLLKFFYFLILVFYHNRALSDYIDESFEDDVKITVSWVQELPWLEYTIYQFKEWAGY